MVRVFSGSSFLLVWRRYFWWLISCDVKTLCIKLNQNSYISLNCGVAGFVFSILLTKIPSYHWIMTDLESFHLWLILVFPRFIYHLSLFCWGFQLFRFVVKKDAVHWVRGSTCITGFWGLTHSIERFIIFSND